MNIKPVPVALVGETLKSFAPLYELNQIACELPLSVLSDVKQRIGDWLASGGKETDPYIKQQVAYAQKVYQALKGGEKG
ncbi:hypothetical protein FJQ98_02825 [Lysinibacillus agricola]|uniref:DUF6877 domain-containing protein n=1 Tax=Lysinibacillus agricola TaxID=2590012 RepID=A0ABX7AXV0_9BACI|nr:MULTISPECIES: DUF6877 family protein [Lysinibacillus]KOS61702.1 hypothetical protein AN161_16145 [Lysinibacillus sp. FJAT-14222]QQP13024.1 hypothetical protein FJQ98_02825 [Lysinibacillus agricola]